MKAVSRTKFFERVKDVGQPAPVSSGPTAYKFRANDGEFDRYNDRLSVDGWQLDAFNANPVVLLNHDAGDGGFLGLGRKDVLPIGKGRAYVQGRALMVDITFDPKDQRAQQVEQKVADGYLNAVSVRYTLPEGAYKENEKGGLDSTAQELLEISVVTIPGNQRALRVKGFSDDESAVLDEVADRIAAKVAEKSAPQVPQFDPAAFIRDAASLALKSLTETKQS